MVEAVEELLKLARDGDLAALGRLLERHRQYLLLLARLEIGRQVRSKLDASDVVQETFLEAHRQFLRYAGGSEQLARWLRQILAGTLAGQLRRYLGTQGRDVRLEQHLAEGLDQSSLALGGVLASPVSTPSQQVVREEQELALADALALLPDDYREALVLRHLQGLTFPEIAQRMGRTQDSVEKLWLRGLGRLRQEMGVRI
ncbi:MAG: sigma-70 family RNA polymerase sigma factor [Gemmataceae bacterium]